jgi:transcriptional regulator with XRE-family HTH domain
MSNKSPSQASPPVINRLGDVMAHLNRYMFKGVARLAFDAGVAPSTVSRLLHHRINPSFALVSRITDALERQLGVRIDPRDVFAEHGRFLTKYACDLVGCPGCLPEQAQDAFGNILPAFSDVEVGRWVTSTYPHGFPSKK